MKVSNVALSIGLVCSMVAGSAIAANNSTATDHTTVNFHGTITETPCTLDSGSADQTVELGHVASSQLKNKGSSTAKTFKFTLTGCDVTSKKTVAVTFNGQADSTDSTLLALASGDASGAGIAINSGTKQLPLGTASSAQTLTTGDNPLTFSAYLKGDGASAVTAGEFSAVSNVTFTYQ